jgi:hypothetical protein
VEWDSLSDPEEGQSDDRPRFPDRAARGSGVIVLARVTVATLPVLAAPAVSFLLTTGIVGSSASIRFPTGYPEMLIVTVLVTVAVTAGIGLLLCWWMVSRPVAVVCG